MNTEPEILANRRRKKLAWTAVFGALAGATVFTTGLQQEGLISFPFPYSLVPMFFLGAGPAMLVCAGMAGRGRAWAVLSTLILGCLVGIMSVAWFGVCTFLFGFFSLLNLLNPAMIGLSILTSAISLQAAREETAWRDRLYSAPTVDPVDE
jgi:hypothetical protein